MENVGKVEKWKAKKIMDPASGKEYAMNPKTREVYDLGSYTQYLETGSELHLVGHIKEITVNGKRTLRFVKL